MEFPIESSGGHHNHHRTSWVWSWGAGTDGQLGTGVADDELLPQPVADLAGVQISAVACGGAHTVAVTGDGKVLTWGRGANGQLGHGDLKNRLRPTLVNFFESFTISDVSAGWNHSGFVTDTGCLFMCGDGSFGQLGTADNKSHSSPLEAPFFVSKHVEQVACGMRHSLVLVKDPLEDSIYGFGAGRRGQIGTSISSTSRCNNQPVQIEGFEGHKIACICANGDHSAALTSDGKLYTWGRGFSGNADEHFPQIKTSSLRFMQVALGWNHALLLADDKVYIFGGERHGMLTHSEQVNQREQASNTSFPCFGPGASMAIVPGLDGKKIVQVAAGAEHSALVTEEGEVMAWGWGEHGQLGLGDRHDQVCPQVVNISCIGSVGGNNLKIYCGSGYTILVKTVCM